MNSKLPKTFRVVIISVLAVIVSGFVFNKSVRAFSPFDFLKLLPPFNQQAKTPEPDQTPLLPAFNDPVNPAPAVEASSSPTPKAEFFNPISGSNSGPNKIISPIPNLGDFFRVSEDKISGRNKITTIGTIVTPVSVANLAMDTKKVQGKTLFDSKGRAILPDGVKVKGKVEFGKDLNFYIDENGNASLYNITAENDLDVLGHIHNSKNKVVEITDPVNLSGGKLYNSLGSVIIDDNLDVSGSLGFSGPVTMNPATPSTKAYKFYSGNIGSPIADNRLIFTDTSGGDARYWFDSSSASSGLSVASTGNEQLYLGYLPSVDTRLMIYQNQPFSIYTGNTTQTPRFTVAANGNVGIGTTSPSQKLHVVGNALIDNGALQWVNSNPQISSAWDTTDFFMDTDNNTTNDVFRVWKGGADITTASNYFTIKNGGNIGIGTTNPGANLHVYTGSTSAATFRLQTKNSWVADLSQNDQSLLTITNGGAIRMALDANGNVGIGLTNPVTALDVVGVINASTGYRIGNGATSGNYMRGNGTNFVSSAIQSTDVNSFISGSPNFLSKFTGANSLGSSLIFDNGTVLGTSANVGIGTTNPKNGLDVTGSVGIGNSVPANQALPQTSMLFVSGNVGIGTTSPSQKLDVVGTIHNSALNGGATTVSTDANGNIIRTPSDVKLKERITSITGALSKVLDLNGVYYQWKDKERFGPQQEVGFIAQEVQKVVPEVVRDGGDYLSLNYGNLTAVLAGAIKDLNGKVDENGDFLTQEQVKNSSLEQRISDAEKQIDAVNRQLGLKSDLSQTAAVVASQSPAGPVPDAETLIVTRQSSNPVAVGSLVMSGPGNTVNLVAANEPSKTLGVVTESVDNQIKVAVLGVTRVSLSSSSAQVKQNDFLTVTLESGKANKAENGDYVVAKALEDGSETGDVLALLVPGYYFNSPNNLSASSPSPAQIFTDGDNVKIDKNTILYKDLNVLGKTALGDLYATGKLTLGLLALDSSDNSINSLGAELKLQSSTTAGNVNIFGGKIMLMSNGDIMTSGSVVADKIKANELTVGKVNVAVLGASDLGLAASSSAQASPSATLAPAPSVSSAKDPTIGSVVIAGGQTSAQITSGAITSGSLIFTTPDQPVAVGTKKGDNTFTITIKEPLNSDLKVNWWIIN